MSKRRIVRYSGTETETVDDVLVDEGPVEFRLEGVPVAVLMRTPGNDEELGLGFVITEGIVLGPHEVDSIAEVPGSKNGDRYSVNLHEGVAIDPEQFRRNVFASSSCGVCGKASIDAVRVAARHVPADPTIDRQTIYDMPAAMRSGQAAFDASGSIHAAAAFDSDGTLVALREDVGRHNAVDKLVGHLARKVWPIPPTVMMVSGRISFEMVQKAAVAGIPIICGVSGASSLAVELGEELGMTVVGFVRGTQFNVYSGVNRIV
ncbi:MAG: formate dehydrogenase accessory sulfurtransferase FdhD [Acidimicrobiia bacterium]